ncbi:MAG: hypothetical protein FWF86_06130, partial [Clostridia bacterium]|nr:hypothetical protein [Clostridia bacterium]
MRTRRGLILLAAVFSLIASGMTYPAQAGEQPPDGPAPVYYNPDGGKNYHGDQNCGGVRKRYLPLSALAFADLCVAPYDALTPCPRCSPPHKPHAVLGNRPEIGEGNESAQLPGTIPLSAECAILYDLSNGRILYEKNAARRCAPASLTKLLTVLTAYAYGGENIEYTVGSEIDLIGNNSSVAFLRKGNVLSFHAIVDAVLLPSGNDAAYALAVNAARYADDKKRSDEEALIMFANLMNETAEALGCTDSHFTAVDGYPGSEHYSTAYDMLRIAIAAANTPVIAKSAAKSRAYHVFLSKREVVWETTNLLLKKDSGFFYQYATGMKTGSTGEAYNLAASAEKEGTSLVAIVLNAD